jgi:hypothetical protein
LCGDSGASSSRKHEGSRSSVVATPFIDIMRTVFPVVALNRDDAGQAARPDFFGTAFAVAPGVFMTAAHVVRAACVRR